MKLFNMYFSPTGGTRKVCCFLQEGFDCPVQQVDLIRETEPGKIHFEADDVCIIGAPVYGGRIPAPQAECLQTLQGNGAKVILAAVYGNRDYDDALLELKDIAKAAGFQPVAAVAALAEHSFAREIAAGRPDAKDEETLKAFAAEVFERIKAGAALSEPDVKGNRPYRAFGGVPVHPAADDSCISCGACVSVCPTGAISADEPEKTDDIRCISCMACVSVCPVEARSMPQAFHDNMFAMLSKVCGDQRKEVECILP